MSAKVQAIPEGYRSIAPALTCKNAAAAIDFYKQVLGAKEISRMPSPDGKIMHAELQIGDSRIFLGDEWPGMAKAPDPHAPVGSNGSTIFFYTEDMDSVMKRATEAGARIDTPAQDMFWGDRYGKFTDPFGHNWGIATHIEDVAPEDMHKRVEAAMKGMSQSAGAAGN
jgi:PhnB protein